MEQDVHLAAGGWEARRSTRGRRLSNRGVDSDPAPSSTKTSSSRSSNLLQEGERFVVFAVVRAARGRATCRGRACDRWADRRRRDLRPGGGWRGIDLELNLLARVRIPRAGGEAAPRAARANAADPGRQAGSESGGAKNHGNPLAPNCGGSLGGRCGQGQLIVFQGRRRRKSRNAAGRALRAVRQVPAGRCLFLT